jgi:lipopolysaccharide export LptBFGC system permease protein LptF
MSALFAASLVYGRFAGDNELDACRASGVSLMTLVYPGLFLGIVVSITTLVLSFYVVPAFVHGAERTIKANAKQILFRNIERKGYYTIPGNKFRIFADHAIPDKDTLEGVVIVETRGDTGNKLMTARAARIVFNTQKRINEVAIIARETYRIDDESQVYLGEFTYSSEFESLLTDNIKFQRIDDLKRIRADMMYFGPIRKVALQCRAQIAVELMTDEIIAKLNDPEHNYRYEFDSENRTILFKAAGARAATKGTIELQGPVKLVEYDKYTGDFICTWECDQATIKLEDIQPGGMFEILLKNPTYDRGDFKGFAQQHVVTQMPLPGGIESRLAEANLLGTIAATGTEGSIIEEPSAATLRLRERLQYEITSTMNEIIAEVHSRLVFGLGCTILILTGIALGIVFKGGHLLTAFGASSIPAAILIVCIMTGKEFTKNPSTATIVGPIVMWVGLAGLSALAFVIYRKLLRT